LHPCANKSESTRALSDRPVPSETVTFQKCLRVSTTLEN
jgi:hypothetical protein